MIFRCIAWNASRLLVEVDDWATASEELYLLMWKIDIEDQRRNYMMSGYEWWLLQDIWTGSNGVVDHFLRPKLGVRDRIKAFNARSIFLQDGLALSYASNATLMVDISLSNFGSADLRNSARIACSVLLDGSEIQSQVKPATTAVAQGSIGVVATIEMVLPNVLTTASVPYGVCDGPKTITITAAFASSPESAEAPPNSWNSTLFPRWEASPSPVGQHVVVTDPALLPRCFSNCGLYPSPSPGSAQHKQVIVTTTITYPLLQEAEQNGSTILLLQNGTEKQFFPTTTTRFKQAWWLGNSVDSNAGTLVYNNSAPILGGMTAGGLSAGLSWFELINDAETFMIDQMPTLPGPWHGPSSSKTYNNRTCQSIADFVCRCR